MEYLIFALAMFFFIVLIMIKGYWDSRQEQKKFVRKLYEQYGSAIDREYGPGNWNSTFRCIIRSMKKRIR